MYIQQQTVDEQYNEYDRCGTIIIHRHITTSTSTTNELHHTI